MKPTIADLQMFVAALFQPEVHEFTFQREQVKIYPFAGGAVRGFRLHGFIYLTQNPNKNSQFGQKARQGSQIVWVIRDKDNEYVGRVIDGVVEVKLNGIWTTRGKFENEAHPPSLH